MSLIASGFVHINSQEIIKLVLFFEIRSCVSQASTKLYVAETEALILLPLLDMQPRPVYVEATTQHKALCMLASTLHRSYGLSFSTTTMLHNIYNYLFIMVLRQGFTL